MTVSSRGFSTENKQNIEVLFFKKVIEFIFLRNRSLAEKYPKVWLEKVDGNWKMLRENVM